MYRFFGLFSCMVKATGKALDFLSLNIFFIIQGSGGFHRNGKREFL